MTAPNVYGRRAISSETWLQIKTAYTSGIGLREIAPNMGIPEGTVLPGPSIVSRRRLPTSSGPQALRR